MVHSLRVISSVTLLAALCGVTGCSTIDRLGAKMDMAANRFSEQGKPVYEGKLVAKKQVGPMIALQFADGALYDVADASPGLIPGDTIRIYKGENGYEARLWAGSKETPHVSETLLPRYGS